ncbi:pyridoxamine 5'-phosphate oxidase family protein [Levyella massiliensis]|uniref:pyridoxamine 5'-phosphate oxidase family protein n=1 Tax=Levyella massiliensis TaxID=938289 RepID=UPI00399BFD5A
MRRKDREVTNLAEIRAFLQEALILHIAFQDTPYPYIVPLHYGFEEHDGKFTFYMHGAKEGRKLELCRKNPHICLEIDHDGGLLSGGDKACAYSAFYMSLIGTGKIRVVEDLDEKKKGLSLLMKTQTGRDFVLTDAMVNAVAVFAVTLEAYTVKSHKKA